MDAAIGLQPITSQTIVRERTGGQNRGDRKEFQRALKEHKSGEQAAVEDEAETSVRPELQPRPAAGRKDQQAHHIDVLA